MKNVRNLNEDNLFKKHNLILLNRNKSGSLPKGMFPHNDYNFYMCTKCNIHFAVPKYSNKLDVWDWNPGWKPIVTILNCDEYIIKSLIE